MLVRVAARVVKSRPVVAKPLIGSKPTLKTSLPPPISTVKLSKISAASGFAKLMVRTSYKTALAPVTPDEPLEAELKAFPRKLAPKALGSAILRSVPSSQINVLSSPLVPVTNSVPQTFETVVGVSLISRGSI